MPQNALFRLVVLTCWRRHNSQRFRNHDLVGYLVKFATTDVRCRHAVLVGAACAGCWFSSVLYPCHQEHY